MNTALTAHKSCHLSWCAALPLQGLMSTSVYRNPMRHDAVLLPLGFEYVLVLGISGWKHRVKSLGHLPVLHDSVTLYPFLEITRRASLETKSKSESGAKVFRG